MERAILYLSAAEVIDPKPERQLATVDISRTLRHTFPVEAGEPVVLDPEVRRNALRAGVWALRNGAAVEASPPGDIDAEALVAWLLDLAEDEAEEQAGERGRRRVERARRTVAALQVRGAITPRDRADVLYALRLAGEVAAWFGEAGAEGYRVARSLVARLVARRTVGAHRLRNVSVDRAVYWGGKAVATYYGVGGLYDAAYAEVRRRPGVRPRAPPKPPGATPRSAPVVVAAAPAERPEAAAVEVLGTLNELDTKGE